MRLLRFAVLMGLLMAAPAAGAADVGRYEITPGPPMILLDTTNGKTWRYDADGKWQPVEVVGPKVTPPKPAESTQQRWQRESEARRLKLKNSGPKPAEKKPIRKLLDKLAPTQ